MTIKTYIEGVHFNFDEDEENPLGPHIHYTTGAASGMDEAFLFKARNTELTEDEQTILKTLSNREENQKEKEDMGVEVNKTLEKENEDLKAEIQALKDSYKLESINKSLEALPFEGDQKEDVVKVLSGMTDEDVVVINKAFILLKDFSEEVKVEKKKEEDTTIQKAMDEEAGVEGEDEVVEKSLNQKILEARGLVG